MSGYLARPMNGFRQEMGVRVVSGFTSLKVCALQIFCSDRFLVRAGRFSLDFRFCIEDTGPGHITLSISELFCRGHTEKLGEWLCWIYTPVLVPWLNPHGFFVVKNEVISLYRSFGESKLVYLFHFNMERWQKWTLPFPQLFVLFCLGKTDTAVFTFAYI